MIDGEVLLGIARSALVERLGGPAAPRLLDVWLEAPAAAFVTIRRGAALHGCIGTVDASRPLGATIARYAVLAALEDPRSSALRDADLGDVRIEVSVLTRPVGFTFENEDDARSKLVPFVDGVVLSYRHLRGVFLPQVWKSMPEPRAFLEALKQKAGLPPTAWYDSIVLERFAVQRFAEAGYGGE